MMTTLVFIAGLFIGSAVTLVAMALLTVAGDSR